MNTRYVGPATELCLDEFVYALDRDGDLLFVQFDEATQLPLFTHEHSMGLFFHEVRGPGLIISQRVNDTSHLLQAIPRDIEIVVDPHRGADGCWQYLKVLRD